MLSFQSSDRARRGGRDPPPMRRAREPVRALLRPTAGWVLTNGAMRCQSNSRRLERTTAGWNGVTGTAPESKRDSRTRWSRGPRPNTRYEP